MKTKYVIIVCMLSLFAVSKARAHALWIDTDPVEGAASFVPDRPGHYLVGALYSVDVAVADHKHLHRIATWSFEIH